MGLDNPTRDALRGRLVGILLVGQVLAPNTDIPVVFAPSHGHIEILAVLLAPSPEADIPAIKKGIGQKRYAPNGEYPCHWGTPSLVILV